MVTMSAVGEREQTSLCCPGPAGAVAGAFVAFAGNVA